MAPPPLLPRPCDARWTRRCLPCKLWWLSGWSRTSSPRGGWWWGSAARSPWGSNLCWGRSLGRRGLRRGSEETWGSLRGRRRVAPLRREREFRLDHISYFYMCFWQFYFRLLCFFVLFLIFKKYSMVFSDGELSTADITLTQSARGITLAHNRAWGYVTWLNI